MKRLLIIPVALALLLLSSAPNGAFAQWRGVSVEFGGFRSGPAWVDRRSGWGGPGWIDDRRVGWIDDRRVVWGSPRWVDRRVIWGGRPWVRDRVAWGWEPGWRVRRGWGFPIAAGLTFAAVGPYAGYDSCLRWNGFRWVNACYAHGSWYW